VDSGIKAIFADALKNFSEKFDLFTELSGQAGKNPSVAKSIMKALK
jgi:hypothetical protein